MCKNLDYEKNEVGSVGCEHVIGKCIAHCKNLHANINELGFFYVLSLICTDNQYFSKYPLQVRLIQDS